MNHIVPIRAGHGVTKVARATAVVLIGTTVAALLIGWTAFLLWLIGSGVIAVVRWA